MCLPTHLTSVNETVSKLRKSEFLRNVLIIMTGSGSAQALGVVLSPVISRLFSPADFGIFGSFSSVAGVIAAGVTLQYSQAIMLPKGREDAINLFVLSCTSTFIVAVALSAVCLAVPSALSKVTKTTQMWVLAFLVFGTLVSGLNQSVQAWAVRAKSFKHTSLSQFIRSVTSNGSQVTFGLAGGGASGLIVSTVVADLVASINLTRGLIPDLRAMRTSIRRDRLKQLAKEYMDFPLYSASQNVINALSSGLPVLLLAHYFGIAVAGAYAFGSRIVQTPMGLVLGALRQVLFQKAAETQHRGYGLMTLYVKTTLGLFVLAVLPSLSIIVWGPSLFSWIFGVKWLIAGVYARYLMLWMLFVFCNLPAVLFARLIRIQRTVFFYDISLLGVRVLALVAGGLYLSAIQTIAAFSIVGAVMNIILIVIVGVNLRKREEENLTGAAN